MDKLFFCRYLGMGPTVIGLLSDWLEPTYKEFSLRWAFCFSYITGILFIL